MQKPKRHECERVNYRLSGKVSVESGGTSGVCLAKCAALCRHGAAESMLGKNKSKGELAV